MARLNVPRIIPLIQNKQNSLPFWKHINRLKMNVIHTPESDKLIQLRRLLRTTRDAMKNKAEVWNRDAEAMEEIVREEREDLSVFDAVQVAECEERAKVFRECIADIQPLICLIDSHFIKP